MTKILATTADLQSHLGQLKSANKTLAMVPTMGNLHAGHLALMEIAKANADEVLASIFVNPTQFAPGEDLDSYPRTLEADVDKLSSIGVNAVFVPTVEMMYPNGQDNSVIIDMPSMMRILCGKDRPTHFQGVATIVTKLLTLIQPDVAVFGKKDFQQQLIIKRLVKEFFLPVKIISGEIVREADGLAMSSRNGYLSANERSVAKEIQQTLKQCKTAIVNGKPINQSIDDAILRLASFGFKVEYLELRDPISLAETTSLEGVLLVAARLGKTRLIDNIELALS